MAALNHAEFVVRNAARLVETAARNVSMVVQLVEMHVLSVVIWQQVAARSVHVNSPVIVVVAYEIACTISFQIVKVIRKMLPLQLVWAVVSQSSQCYLS